MNKKVISYIVGGLGNQLFCYAAARRLAIRTEAELVLDNVSFFKTDKLYSRHYQLNHYKISGRPATAAERLEPFSRVRRSLLRYINKNIEYNKRSYIQQVGFEFDERLLKYEFNKTVVLDGYWQSASYFEDVEDIIRSDLTIKAPLDSTNISMAK